MRPYLEPHIEFFDRAATPPEIAELLEGGPEIDPGTARLIRAAVMSREQQADAQGMGHAVCAGELVRAAQIHGSGR